MSTMEELADLAETRLLGTLLWGGDLELVRQHVDGESFSPKRDAHRAVWQAIVAVHESGRKVDGTAVLEQVLKDGTLDRIGGPTAIHDLASAAGTKAEAEHYAREVAQIAWRRRAHQLSVKLQHAAADPTVDVETAIADAQAHMESAPASDRLPLYVGQDIGLIPPPVWLIDGHVIDGLALWYGPYESGKTMVVLDAFLSVVSGSAWWGNSVKRRKGLYVAAEGSSGVAQRMQAWAAEKGTSLDGVALTGEPVNLHRPRDVARLDDAVRRHDAGLLVLDTWARVTAGGDENDNGRTSLAVEHLDRLRARRGCAVWVVHHTTKGTDDPRGASSLPGAADTGIAVSREGRERPTIKVRTGKQKDGPDFRPMSFRIAPRGVSAVLERLAEPAGGYADIDQKRAAALEMMRRGEFTRTELEAKFGVEPIRSLVSSHRDVRQVERGGRKLLTAKQGSPV